MGYIYKIVNDINEYMYIGQTEYENPLQRWKEHLQDYKKDRCARRPLYQAMRQYGVEHFRFEIIEETENTVDREMYWINELRTYIGFEDCCGYNATLGGVGKLYLTLDDNEVKEKYYEYNKNMFKTATFFKVDPATIRSILQRLNVKTNSSRESVRITQGRAILQLDPTTLNVVRKFEAIADANRFFGKAQSNGNIRHALKNSNKTAYGYKWCYGE